MIKQSLNQQSKDKKTVEKTVVGAIKAIAPAGTFEVQPVGLELIEEMAKEGMDNTTIHSALGIAKDTFRLMRQRQPDVLDALDRGRAALADELTHILLTKARSGNIIAAIFLAKARCGWREGEPPPDTRPNVIINLPESHSPEEYLKMINPKPKELNHAR